MQLALISTSVTNATQWDAGTNRTVEWKDYTVAEPRGRLKIRDMRFSILGCVVLGVGSRFLDPNSWFSSAMPTKNSDSKGSFYCGRLNIPTITALPMT